jgi:mannosyltransferase OCH1-like enzyme
MFATAELPPRWRDTPTLWRAHHPHWNYTLWTDDALRQLVATHYPWLLPTYDAYPYDTQRWDASRYALLHHYGGVYADLDLQPTRSIHQLTDGRAALLPRTPNIGLTNAFMASAPGHPFFLHVLQQLPAYARAWYHLSKHNAVLSSTGSTLVWAMAMGWARRHGGPDQPTVVAAADWGKSSFCNAAPGRPREGPATAPSERWASPLQHVRGSSWHSADSTLVLTLYCHMDVMAVGAFAAFIWWRRRSARHAAAAVFCGFGASQLNRSLEVSLAETLLFRPWIWLIMT